MLGKILKPVRYEEVLIYKTGQEKFIQFPDARFGRQLLECLVFLHLSLFTQSVLGFAAYQFGKEGFNQIICQAQLINHSVIEAGLYRVLMLRISLPSPTSCHHLPDYASLLVHLFSR